MPKTAAGEKLDPSGNNATWIVVKSFNFERFSLLPQREMDSKKQKILKKLKNKYRLVLINDGSFAEVFSIRLTPMNVLMLASSSLLLFTLIIFALIAYTPVRQLVPGYGKVSDNAAIIELTQEVEELTRQQKAGLEKQEALRIIINGGEEVWDSSRMTPPAAKK